MPEYEHSAVAEIPFRLAEEIPDNANCPRDKEPDLHKEIPQRVFGGVAVDVRRLFRLLNGNDCVRLEKLRFHGENFPRGTFTTARQTD